MDSSLLRRVSRTRSTRILLSRATRRIHAIFSSKLYPKRDFAVESGYSQHVSKASLEMGPGPVKPPRPSSLPRMEFRATKGCRMRNLRSPVPRVFFFPFLFSFFPEKESYLRNHRRLSVTIKSLGAAYVDCAPRPLAPLPVAVTMSLALIHIHVWKACLPLTLPESPYLHPFAPSHVRVYASRLRLR